MRLRDFADFYPEQAAVGAACVALLVAGGLAKLCGGVGSRTAGNAMGPPGSRLHLWRCIRAELTLMFSCDLYEPFKYPWTSAVLAFQRPIASGELPCGL